MREMERRKRVEMIMNSRLFREELERIIEAQMKDGGGPVGLLQQISDMMGLQGGRLHPGHMFKSEQSHHHLFIAYGSVYLCSWYKSCSACF
jgi:adducin